MELLNYGNNKQPNEPVTQPVYKHRISKRWKKVRPGTHPNKLNETNDTIAIQYYQALKFLKSQCLAPGTLYFERDYKKDYNDPFALHSFVCEQFSFYLECDFNCFMQIHYDFNDFPHLNEVLRKVSYAAELGKCLHKPKSPSLPAYFKGVIAYQDKQYIHTHSI